ncbi:MAG TPA: YggT family protein [Patescibacteria group bacterium]|nr:YggT family protein [Patescibacteria group bacterium]
MADEVVVRRDSSDDVVTTRAGNGSVFKVTQVVYFVAGIIEALLALRFLFQLLGANRGSPFVDFVYDLSHPLVGPFFGMFGSAPAFGVGRIEVETLVAIVVYAFVAYLVARLIEIIT